MINEELIKNESKIHYAIQVTESYQTVGMYFILFHTTGDLSIGTLESSYMKFKSLKETETPLERISERFPHLCPRVVKVVESVMAC